MTEPSTIKIDEVEYVRADSVPSNTPEGILPGDPTGPVLIRTVTMHYTGRVVASDYSWLVLDEAAWIADTGRFADALQNGKLSEVEPMGDGIRVARSCVVDVSPWRHPLPKDQK